MTAADDDLRFLRLAIAEAAAAREQGEDPFGAVLVVQGRVVATARDGCVRQSDPTRHAELSLISDYCRAGDAFDLGGYAIYCSAEPCAMCAGAIHWARISRVVYSVSQETLQRLSGGRPKPGCRSILQSGRRTMDVVGPLLAEEGLAVFEGWQPVPKRQRIQARADAMRSHA